MASHENPTHEDSESDPTTEELEEPSTEKDPGEEPATPAAKDDEAAEQLDEAEEDDKSHQAVGIGVVGGSQVEQPDEEAGPADQ